MKVDLKDYSPIGNQVLLKLDVKGTTDAGIILQKGKADKWLEVTKIGSIVQTVKVGDFIILGQPQQMVQLEFEKEQYIQVREHDIVGYVDKSSFGKKVLDTLTGNSKQKNLA